MTTTLTLALLVVSSQSPPEPWLGCYFSSLRPGTSQLGSLCFLFQGFPDAVLGVQFGYYDKDRRSLETYLKNLLERPANHQLSLKESAEFLASRTYVDDPGRRVYIVLTRSDALKRYHWRYDQQKGRFSNLDRLLLRTLDTYYELTRGPEEAKYPWPKPTDRFESLVKKNLDSVVTRLTVVKSIDESWRHPGIYR
jgi:hypothetical protein